MKIQKQESKITHTGIKWTGVNVDAVNAALVKIEGMFKIKIPYKAELSTSNPEIMFLFPEYHRLATPNIPTIRVRLGNHIMISSNGEVEILTDLQVKNRFNWLKKVK